MPTTGVPADSAAVILNVTAVAPTGPGHLRVFPCGGDPPHVSSVNYGAGNTVANAVVTAMGTGGRVCVYTSTTAHVVVDLAGYFPAGLPMVRDVAAGGGFTCAVVADGSVKCWGRNTKGQLGDGSTTTRTTPVTVIGIAGATSVAAGGDHACAVVAGGAVKCWGDDGKGQLGDGTTTSRTGPVTVTGLASVAKLATFGDHTCAISGGQVRCWGVNGKGQLGDGTTTNRVTPVAVASLSGATAVTATYYSTCAIIAGGQMRCWGSSASGQLGAGAGLPSAQTTPVAVVGLSGATKTGGADHSACALVGGGQLRCWGGNEYGQLGDGAGGPGKGSNTPVGVLGLASATDLTANSAHACVIDGGRVKCWGSNAAGQLGDGTTTHRYTPVRVVGL